MRISDWSSDVCSSDLRVLAVDEGAVDVEDDEAVAEGECRHGRCLYHVGAACLSRFLPPESPGNLTDRHAPPHRSDEHTSELQSLMRISYAVFCLKKTKTQYIQIGNR